MNFNPKLLIGVLIMSAVLLMGLMIAQILRNDEMTYSLNQEEEEFQIMKQEVAGLRVKLSKNRNLDNFSEKIKDQGFEEIAKIDYIVISEGNIASK